MRLLWHCTERSAAATARASRVRATLGAGLAPLVLIQDGEALLRDVDDASLLAQLLAARSEVLWRAGDLESAKATLSEARAVAPDGDVESVNEITAVEALLDRHPE